MLYKAFIICILGHTKQFGYISNYTIKIKKIKVNQFELILIHSHRKISLSQAVLYTIVYFKNTYLKLSYFLLFITYTARIIFKPVFRD